MNDVKSFMLLKILNVSLEIGYHRPQKKTYLSIIFIDKYYIAMYENCTCIKVQYFNNT